MSAFRNVHIVSVTTKISVTSHYFVIVFPPFMSYMMRLHCWHPLWHQQYSALATTAEQVVLSSSLSCKCASIRFNDGTCFQQSRDQYELWTMKPQRLKMSADSRASGLVFWTRNRACLSRTFYPLRDFLCSSIFSARCVHKTME